MPILTVGNHNKNAPAGPGAGDSLIDEIVREGARRTLAAALQAEVAAYGMPRQMIPVVDGSAW
jgi:putative transposase